MRIRKNFSRKNIAEGDLTQTGCTLNPDTGDFEIEVGVKNDKEETIYVRITAEELDKMNEIWQRFNRES